MDKTRIEAAKSEKSAIMAQRTSALKDYADKHSSIKKPLILKFASGAWYIILRVFSMAMMVIFLLGFLYAQFTTKYLVVVNEQSSGKVQYRIEDAYKYAGVICLAFALMFWWISVQLKKIQRRNRSITMLSDLVKKIIDAEGKNLEAEKQNYQRLQDALAESGIQEDAL